jgi:hypothetical protein
MQRAALIAGIDGSVLVMTIMLMLTIDGAGPRHVISYRNLALVNMLKMNGDKLRETGNLRNEIDPQHPWDEASYGVPRFNFSSPTESTFPPIRSNQRKLCEATQLRQAEFQYVPEIVRGASVGHVHLITRLPLLYYHTAPAFSGNSASA